MRDIKARLVEMLTERKIKHHLMDTPANKLVPWVIQYKFDNGDGLGSWKLIMPNSPISEQDWMEAPIVDGDNVEFISFEAWISAVDKLFVEEFGMESICFEDYNWRDEYESEVTPEASFAEWKAYNEESFGR